MRICLYTNTALPLVGGQELAVDALARELLAAGHEPVVLAPRPSQSWRLQDASLPYAVARHPRFISTRRFVSFYRRWLLRLHRRRPLDIVHCHGVYPTGYVAALCRNELGCPLVVTSQGEDRPESSDRFQKPTIEQRVVQTLAAADALVSISRFTRDGFLQLLPGCDGRIVDIPNGVDCGQFLRAAQRPEGLDAAIQPNQYALFLGRLHRRKGVDVLLQALALTPRRAAVQLVIAGGGDERDALKSLAAEFGLQSRVRFVGPVVGTAKTYLVQNSRCLVAPSRGWEGLPLVALESFAAGRPVIASDLPGLTEVVKSGETGLVVPPESPECLAAALRLIFDDPQLLAVMGRRAAEIAVAHDWRTIAAAHIALYERLREQRGERSSGVRAAQSSCCVTN